MPDASGRSPHIVDTGVVIVGTGFSGLCLATLLARAGEQDFVLLERAASVGGTWRDNTYPGAACDIPSHLYSYSFRPNPDWSRVYASQPEILDYLQETAEEEGLLPRIRLDAEVLAATWGEASGRWLVRTTRGLYRARVLVTASGHLSDPSYPDIPGLESFAGRLFHSARWDHAADWQGQRVGVIGTGASAIQVVPELAKGADRLTVFQRSAPYVIPRPDRAYSPAERRLFRRMPGEAQALRDDLFWGNESRFPQRRRVPDFVEQIATAARTHLHNQVTDPDLRRRLQPGYEVGCKRILVSNDYYPTLALPHVDLETEPIDRITAAGITTRSGREIGLDLLIVATGFEATDLPIAHRITGRASLLLADAWRGGGQAYRCTTVAGFPNLFVMLGPNTGLGAGSMIYMIETQARYIAEAVRYATDHDLSLEPTEQAQASYVASIAQRAAGTVWIEGGCQSWYLHPDSGRLTTLWPDFMSQFRAENGSFDSAGYLLRPAAGEPEPVGDRLLTVTL